MLLPTLVHMQCHNLTFINTLSKTYAFLHESSHVMPMFRALTDSLTLAHVMYEKPLFSKQKIYFFIFQLLGQSLKNRFIQKPCVFFRKRTFRDFTTGVVHIPTLSWTFTIGCICLTKNTSLSPEGMSIPSCYYPTHKFSNRATLGRRPFFRAHHLNNKHHALTPVSLDVPVHMQCKMPLHILSCYMHDESYMQHL